MRNLVIALLFATGGLALGAQPSRAEITYPWCAQYGDMHGGTNCGFSTYAQCRAALSGNGGYCLENPMYRLGIEPVRRARRTSG